MDQKNIDFAALKRLAPGRFTEDLLDALKTAVTVDGFHIELAQIELGEDPGFEKVNAVFFVSTDKERPRTPPCKGSKLFFTFTSEASLQDNLAEFKVFVREHAETAASAPVILHSMHGHTGV